MDTTLPPPPPPPLLASLLYNRHEQGTHSHNGLDIMELLVLLLFDGHLLVWSDVQHFLLEVSLKLGWRNNRELASSQQRSSLARARLSDWYLSVGNEAFSAATVVFLLSECRLLRCFSGGGLQLLSKGLGQAPRDCAGVEGAEPWMRTMEPAETDENYYNLILDYLNNQTLPENLSETKLTMIIRRSRHYRVVHGQLTYGLKHPKKVVIYENTRHFIMQDIHINKETGVHLGVQKMHAQLKKEYFWRGMYVDITKFVRECKQCIDADLPVASIKLLAYKRKKSCQETDSDYEDTDENPQERSPTDKNPTAWKKVELRLNGPYTDGKYILSITDPYSSWIEATVVEPPDLCTKAAEFLFSTFCQFGFACLSTVGFAAELLTDLQQQYEQMVADLFNSHFHNETELKRLTNCKVEETLCPWTTEFFSSLVEQYPDTWHKQLPKYLFYFHCKPKGDNQISPFMSMFQRTPVPDFTEEDKENAGKDKNDSTSFSTKVQPKAMNRTKRRVRRMAAKINNDEEFSYSEEEDEPDEITDKEDDVPQSSGVPVITKDHPEVCEARASTVAAVQALLSATKEERSRRGQYQRYSANLRDEMASYAIEHGSLAAVKYFRDKLRIPVSESTIRNFAKNYQTFSPELQDQIGAFAMKNSLELTVTHFTEQLGFEVRINTVRKFKKNFAAKFPKEKDATNSANQPKVSNKKKCFSMKLKEEIGSYAVQYGIQMAVEHYSSKLQEPINEITVKKFKELYEEKQKESVPPIPTELVPNISQTLQSETMDVVQASFNVLNCSPTSQTLVYNQQPTYQQLISPISFHSNTGSIDHNVGYQQQSVASVISTNPTLVFSQATFQSPATYSSNFTQLTSSNIHLPSTTDETHNNPPLIRVLKMGCDESKKSPQEIFNPESDRNSTVTQDIPPNKPATRRVTKPKNKKVKTTTKKCEKNRNRGNYTTYSPEIRADIGCYAAHHGNQQAVIHFRNILGYDLPESTVRGLKEKYLAKKQLCSEIAKGKKEEAVTSLGFAPRGRPMRLGKYDGMVHQCIKDLVSKGERVTSFLAIATAKQVLMEHEPSLLAENGGSCLGRFMLKGQEGRFISQARTEVTSGQWPYGWSAFL
ncbi:hypothetical protein B566_EDAN001687 [Ephemera danica]|nr:hypothetical protein B566_EDAN001687 [Ephemera danica]